MIDMLSVQPAALRKLFMQHLQDGRQLAIGAALFGEPVHADLAAIRTARMQLHVEGRLLAAGAPWTPQRLVRVGYILDATCAKCGASDSLYHRLWSCTDHAVEAIRAGTSTPPR